jgi:hypothetical protein
LKFTFSPHAKACAQVGAPLVAAAAGLTFAAFVCHDGAPSARTGQGSDLADAAKAGYASGASSASLTPTAGRLAGVAWTRPAKAHDLDCLSEAVYFEARGESAAGQAAVAQVVLNRARHPAYPKSVCGVVFQAGGNGGCQFSFVCDGAMARPLEPVAWRRARTVATRALEGYVMTAVGRALNFHAADASPDAQAGTTVARLGHHVFFVAAARSFGVRLPERRREGAIEPAPQTSDTPATHEAVQGVAMALGDLGLFPKAAADAPTGAAE